MSGKVTDKCVLARVLQENVKILTEIYGWFYQSQLENEINQCRRKQKNLTENKSIIESVSNIWCYSKEN